MKNDYELLKEEMAAYELMTDSEKKAHNDAEAARDLANMMLRYRCE